jgi:hypothetical protein
MLKTLSSSVWIHTGTGCLYSPPFVSRCVVYRLYDISLSLLLYHDPTVSSCVGAESDGGEIAVNTIWRQPEAIYVHLSPSTNNSVEKLIEEPRTRLEIDNSCSSEQSFRDIALHVEPIRLPLKDMLIVGRGGDRVVDRRITNTAYCVRSSARLAAPGIDLGQSFRCWKLSIFSRDKKRTYDHYSGQEWSLTAFSVEGDWRPVSEFRLVKNHN